MVIKILRKARNACFNVFEVRKIIVAFYILIELQRSSERRAGGKKRFWN